MSISPSPAFNHLPALGYLLALSESFFSDGNGYLGENPFGFAALDIKSKYMGAFGCCWAQI